MHDLSPSVVESLVHIWKALHRDLDVEIDAVAARYLQSVVIGIDDELIATLLGAKLAMARLPNPVGEDDLAMLGSDVTYSIRGRSRSVQLVHGDRSGLETLGVGSRFGAAVLGLRPGQSILWPLEVGRLVEVHVRAVSGRRAVRARGEVNRGSVPCAFG